MTRDHRNGIAAFDLWKLQNAMETIETAIQTLEEAECLADEYQMAYGPDSLMGIWFEILEREAKVP